MSFLRDLSSVLCKVPEHEVQGNAYVLEYYPEINLNSELNSSALGRPAGAARSMGSWRNVMLPVNEGVLKRITRVFLENGIQEALNEARDPRTRELNPLVATLAEYTVQIMYLVEKYKRKIFPYSKKYNIESVAQYAETRGWDKSYIRALVWHPNCFKIAVAGCDDLIRIYSDAPAVVPVLKNTSQRWITCMAFRPFCAGELAVGCEKGICWWIMDSNVHVAKNSTQMLFLNRPNHCPVTSVQWNLDGSLLASASIADTDVLIWHVDTMENTPLRRVGPPCTLLKWSPDSAYVFSATIGNVFRVWSVDNLWTPERWTIKSGTVSTACWSPCSSYLVFATSEDCALYSLQFHEELVFKNETSPKVAYPVADLSPLLVGEHEVGGRPQALAWDPNGLYLAVTFRDSSCIAIFNTCVQRLRLTLSPASFLTGMGNEIPAVICFQSKNRKNSDSVLTIGWSSGRIQYFPLSNM